MDSKAVKDTPSLDSILEMIGKKLYEFRVKKGYKSHADFADAHDLPRIQYWRMEKGRSNITLKSLLKVLDIHEITIEDLFAEIKMRKAEPLNGHANNSPSTVNQKGIFYDNKPGS